MRQIKFRAWEGKENKMTHFDLFNGAGSWLDVTEYPETAPISVMQYTGLKDKNGKEIYEGDIVKTGEDYTGVVVWDDEETGYLIDTGREDDDGNVVFSHSEAGFSESLTTPMVILGNIYENPEILNSENR